MPYHKLPGTLSTNQALGEPRFPCHDSRAILHPVLKIQRNTNFSLHFERNSHLPVATLEESPSFQQQLENNAKFLLHLERRPIPLPQLKTKHDFSVSTRKKT